MFLKIRRTGMLYVTSMAVFGLTGTAYGTDAAPEAVKEAKTAVHYPDRFDGTGRIDRFDGEEIVIDDSLYKFSSFAKFCTPEKKYAPRSLFKNRTRVGYVINSEGKITGLYLIENALRAHSP